MLRRFSRTGERVSAPPREKSPLRRFYRPGYSRAAPEFMSSRISASARPHGQHPGFARTNSAKSASYSAVIFSSP